MIVRIRRRAGSEQLLGRQREQQSFDANAEPGTLSIRPTAGDLLLRRQFPAANLEPLPVQVLADTSLRSPVEFVAKSQ